MVQGVVHITGGGFPENIPRIVPKGRDLGFRIRRDAWSVPPLFQWLQQVDCHLDGLVLQGACSHVLFVMAVASSWLGGCNKPAWEKWQR